MLQAGAGRVDNPRRVFAVGAASCLARHGYWSWTRSCGCTASMRTPVAKVAPLLAYLRELQRRRNLAVLLVHHAKKSGGRLRADQANSALMLIHIKCTARPYRVAVPWTNYRASNLFSFEFHQRR